MLFLCKWQLFAVVVVKAGRDDRPTLKKFYVCCNRCFSVWQPPNNCSLFVSMLSAGLSVCRLVSHVTNGKSLYWRDDTINLRTKNIHSSILFLFDASGSKADWRTDKRMVRVVFKMHKSLSPTQLLSQCAYSPTYIYTWHLLLIYTTHKHAYFTHSLWESLVAQC